MLEKIATCRTAIFDKTGTLTYGQPQLTELLPAPGFDEADSARRWSPVWSATRSTRWPAAILDAADKRGVELPGGQRRQRARRARGWRGP